MRGDNETFYRGRDNVARRFLTSAEAVIADLSAVTRVVVSFGGVDFDSDVAAYTALIWWDDQATDPEDGVEKDVLSMQLGTVLGIIADGDYRPLIKAYDAAHTNGLAYDDPNLIFTVRT